MVIVNFIIWLPLWLMAVVLLAWFSATGLLAHWAAKRWILPSMKLRYDDAYFAAAIVQSAMLMYGLIAALTAVGVWQRFSQVSDTVSSEAATIASLWRDLGGYPEPLSGEMRGVLKGYTEQIIRDAWPEQRQGRIPRQGVEWMDRLQARLYSFEPTTAGQQIIHSQTVGAFNDLVQKRRQRLDSVDAAIPGVLWCVLLPGAMACMAICVFFHVERERFKVTLLLCLAVFLTMVLFMIFALDRPYCGDTGITAEPYQLIYDHHMLP